MPFHPALPKQTERQFLEQVKSAARLFGWAWWHDSATNAPRNCWQCGAHQRVERNLKGFPDLLLVRGEDLLFVELKSDRGRTSEAQSEWLGRLGAVRRVRVEVWRPAIWRSVELALKGDDR
jgi:hypothetical protein